MIVNIICCFTVILLIRYIYTQCNEKKLKKKYCDLKKVPEVEGKLPIVGHGIKFSKDILGFVRESYKKYGKIFKIKIFNRDLIVVCDRTLINEYFSAKENEMSLYRVLENLFFANGFFDNPKEFETSIKIIKGSVSIRYDDFVPKIQEEAQKMIEIMKKECGNNNVVDMTKKMIRFVSRTSASCFICMDLSEEFMEALETFTDILNKIVVLTYFFPVWLLHITVNKFILRKHKEKMISIMNDEIEKYRNDKSKTDSVIFRTAVDYIDENGNGLNNHQIGEIVVCLLYVSSENTALGLSAAMTELSRSERIWNLVKKESEEYLSNNDMKSLFASELIDGCVMESSRLCSHVFALNRKPEKKKQLGDYYIGNCDSVALCEPLLMSLDCSNDLYSNPLEYNPERFIGKKSEKKTPDSILTWGHKIHLCPGKAFAVYEIKLAMALLTTNFERFKIDDNEYKKLDYFSPSAFAERKVTVKPVPIKSTVKINKNIFYVENDKIKVEYFEEGGWLIRDYLNMDEQEKLYNYTINLSKESKEHKEILESKSNNPYPISYYNLVYTGTSNCEPPTLLFEISEKIWNLLRNMKHESKSKFPNTNKEFDSMYAQLYGEDSVMKVHKDEHVDYGISFSLGATCDFLFGNKTIKLFSGDIFVADFSKVDHAVLKIYGDLVPQWFNNQHKETNVKTFGNKKRLSIQIRDISNCIVENKINMEEFKNMINKTHDSNENLIIKKCSDDY